MNEIYIIDGQKFDVAPNRKDEFLQKYPNATLYKEPVIPEDSGKTTPTAPGAVVEETAAPEIQPTVTESPLVDTSLELPQTGTVDSTIKKPKIRTESELKIDATRNAMSIASPVVSIMPDFMIPVLADWTAMTAETAAGVADTTEILYESLLAATTDETFDKIAREQRIDMSNVYEGVEALRNIREKKYDEQGNELDAIGLWESGRKSESAKQFVSEAIGSLPSTVLTYMLPGAGSAIIGAGVLGSEFEKNLKERPDETAGAMLSNAAIKGGSEAIFEFLGGYTFKQISKIGGKKLTQKAITELTKDAIPYALGKILGVGAQGVSEAATEAATGMAQLYADQLVFGDKIDSSQYWRTAIHSGIVGGLMGGGITAGTVGAQVALTGDRKKAALSIIAPKQWKSEQIQIGREIDQAAKDYQAAPQNKKKFFKNKIEVLEQRQQGRAERLSKTWDGLTRSEKINYAKLLDEANSQLDIVGNNKYTKKAQDDAQLALNEAYSGMQNILGKDNVNADIEQSISKTLKASQSILEQVEKAKTIKNLNIQSVSNETFEEVSKAVTGKKSAADAIFFDGNNIYINKDISAITEQTNVVGHELLHYLMAKNFDTSNESMQPLVDSFKDYLKETQPEIFERVESRINSLYTDEKTGEIKKGALEEYLNVFSDLIAKEKIVVNETFSDKIKNTTTRFLNGLGFGSIKLETGKDVFNFIRNYNKNISNFKYKQLGIDITSDKISKGVNEEVAKKSISGNNIQKIFDEKGKDGAFDIIEAYKPLTTRLTNKYRDVPGFDFELLQSEIEIGKRGLLDLINAYDSSKGATLNTYIQGQLANRSIEAANRILDTEFKLDVTEAKGVTDTTTEETIEAAEEAEFADEIKSLRKEIGLSEELVNTVKDAVVKTFGTKLPNPQDPKFRLELQKRFRTELKKPIAKFVGKQVDYESFLRDNFQSIYNKLPQSLINRRFKDFQEPVLDKNGKHVREKTAEGNKVYTKKKISKAEFIKYFLGSEVGRSTQGTRKTAIVEAVAEEIAFDATMEVLNDPDVIQKYQDIAGITGEVLPENFKSIIAKQVDRAENFKFSKSLIDDASVKYNLTQQELGRLLFEKTMTELANEFPELADSINNENFKKSYPKVFYTIVVPAFEKAINKSIAEGSTQQAEQIVISFIKTFSRGTRTFSTKKGELNLTTNRALWENVIYPAIKGTGLSSKKKFNLLKSGKRSYIRYGESPVITLIDVTNKDTRNDILSGIISKEEVNIQNRAALNELKNIIFNIGNMHPGLALSIIKVNQKDQRTLFRNAAILNRVVQNYKGDTVYEHNPPVQYVFNEIVNYLSNPTKNKKENLISLLNTMEANLVPKDFAQIVDKKFKDTMPADGTFRYDEALAETNYTFDEGNFKFSKSLNKEFNTILEQSSGIKATKKFSPVEARIAGKGKGKLKLFIPYSADDFVGLLYTTLAGGKTGDQQMDWYRENLLRPFSRGIQQYEAAKQNALREWQILKKEAKKSVPGGLNKKNASGLTNQEAVRLYIWKQQGMEIPGTKGSAAFVNENLKTVRKNPELKAFAERLMALNPEGYPAPSDNWDSGDITTDLVSYIDGVKRGEFLTEFKDNAAKIFSDSNKEKLRALYGDNFIEALDDMLHRMKTGTNRRFGASKIERQFMDWTNNSVGAIMFFNARSAVLQTLSAVNFINFTDNNPINAAKAFANLPQYVNDFSTLFNSDFLKQRRTGLQTDVNADEIARAAKGAKNTAKAMLSAILKFGFTPTQIADSFAIASGGATFYRNRINKYKKEGLSQQEAETKAFTDFQEIAEETQQSARPDRISLQQASSLGRLILAFGNTPMQYARLTKKASLDLINGRGDWKTNVSKIMYYSVIQNIIFSALQQGLFALLFDDEDDDKEKSRLFRIGNSSLDTFLRGSGVYGAAAATVKNMILEIIDQQKSGRPDYSKIAIEATAISPPINSKLRKLESAGKTFTYKQSREKVFTEGFSLENPAFLAAGKVISAGTNLPADRVVLKADHLYTAMQPETELWQSLALSLGWSEWDLNMIQNQTKNAKGQRKRIQRTNSKRKRIKR